MWQSAISVPSFNAAITTQKYHNSCSFWTANFGRSLEARGDEIARWMQKDGSFFPLQTCIFSTSQLFEQQPSKIEGLRQSDVLASTDQTKTKPNNKHQTHSEESDRRSSSVN